MLPMIDRREQSDTGQSHLDLQPASLGISCDQTATVAADRALRDSQTKAGAAASTGTRAVGAIERLEDAM